MSLLVSYDCLIHTDLKNIWFLLVYMYFRLIAGHFRSAMKGLYLSIEKKPTYVVSRHFSMKLSKGHCRLFFVKVKYQQAWCKRPNGFIIYQVGI